MTALDLLAELHARGVSVSLVGQALRVSAPGGAVDDALKAELAQHKPELVRILSAATACAEVVVEAHGIELAITADGRSSRGLPALSHTEVDTLATAANGTPLSPEMVRAIAAVKGVFPGAVIESARATNRSKPQPAGA